MTQDQSAITLAPYGLRLGSLLDERLVDREDIEEDSHEEDGLPYLQVELCAVPTADRQARYYFAELSRAGRLIGIDFYSVYGAAERPQEIFSNLRQAYPALSAPRGDILTYGDPDGTTAVAHLSLLYPTGEQAITMECTRYLEDQKTTYSLYFNMPSTLRRTILSEDSEGAYLENLRKAAK